MNTQTLMKKQFAVTSLTGSMRFLVPVCLAVAPYTWAENTAANECPVYTTPNCRDDQQLVQAPVPAEFQVAGCAQTMPLCEALPLTDEDLTPVRECGPNQRYIELNQRCENIDAACPPFLRLCTSGETTDALCSCTPTVASTRGVSLCVPPLECPDTRVLNCDAERQTGEKNCTVTPVVTSPTVSVTTPWNDTIQSGPADSADGDGDGGSGGDGAGDGGDAGY